MSNNNSNSLSFPSTRPQSPRSLNTLNTSVSSFSNTSVSSSSNTSVSYSSNTSVSFSNTSVSSFSNTILSRSISGMSIDSSQSTPSHSRSHSALSISIKAEKNILESCRSRSNSVVTLVQEEDDDCQTLVSLPSKSKSSSTPNYLPIELWRLILEQVCKSNTPSVLDPTTLRLLNRKFKALSNIVLSRVYQSKVDSLSIECLALNGDFKALQAVKNPQLDHFRQFLMVPTTMENLNEIIWYTNAQIEVQSVCECLVRLFGAYKDIDSETRISWIEIRKTMRKQEFKLWIANLAVNVEFVDIQDTKKVEQIIRVDPLITYERLREVSMPAYRLLILVAATLQYSTISSELALSKSKLSMVEKRLSRSTSFLDCLQ